MRYEIHLFLCVQELWLWPWLICHLRPHFQFKKWYKQWKLRQGFSIQRFITFPSVEQSDIKHTQDRRICVVFLCVVDQFQLIQIWIKRGQLGVTCFIISIFTTQHVSDVNTSILRSLRLIWWVISWVVFLWFDVCWCYVVVVWYPDAGWNLWPS